MPHPYPGQQWKHGWIPLTGTAKVSKNHGRKPAKGGSSGGEGGAPTKAGPAATPGPGRGGKTRSRAAVKPQWPKRKQDTGPAPKATDPAGTTTAPARDKAFLDKQYGQWRKDLTPAQDKAMRFYQSPGFALMNGQLRGLDKRDIKADVSFNDDDLARARKASKDLTAAIKKAPPLAEPMKVFRGFSADQFGDVKPGDIVPDKGFVSTSLTPDVGSVGKARRPATAEIVLPKGTKAAAGSSRELVLPPGSRFRVLDTTTRKGVPHYRLELVL